MCDGRHFHVSGSTTYKYQETWELQEAGKMFTPLRVVYTAIDFLAVITALVIAVPFFLLIASPFLMGV